MSTFQIYCSVGVKIAQMVVQFAHFQVQGRMAAVTRGVLCMYISSKGVCDGRVKIRSWWWYFGQNETPSGQNETPSRHFVRKVGKSALELGICFLIMGLG